MGGDDGDENGDGDGFDDGDGDGGLTMKFANRKNGIPLTEIKCAMKCYGHGTSGINEAFQSVPVYGSISTKTSNDNTSDTMRLTVSNIANHDVGVVFVVEKIAASWAD